jgi:cytochrome bd ubiquinol oxidase subunit II
MSPASLLAVFLGLALTAYALFAGADFGAGILDLLAARRTEDRAVIEAGIGPLWEANHVWLIFAITILFSAFPTAFSALGTELLAPLAIALLAIVARGAAFGLRSGLDRQTVSRARLSRVFGAASVVAPLAFGLVAGGLAQASSVRSVPGGRVSVPWTSPFAIVVGLLAVCLCVELAATFMAGRLVRVGPGELAGRFRARALQAGAGSLLLSVGGLVLAEADAPRLFARLTHAALPLVVLAVACFGLSWLAMLGRRYAIARAASLAAGAALVWGWFLAQSPHLVGPLFTIHTAAATGPALTAIAIACGVVLLGVIPAMFLLYSMFARPSQR